MNCPICNAELTIRRNNSTYDDVHYYAECKLLCNAYIAKARRPHERIIEPESNFAFLKLSREVYLEADIHRIGKYQVLRNIVKFPGRTLIKIGGTLTKEHRVYVDAVLSFTQFSSEEKIKKLLVML